MPQTRNPVAFGEVEARNLFFEVVWEEVVRTWLLVHVVWVDDPGLVLKPKSTDLTMGAVVLVYHVAPEIQSSRSEPFSLLASHVEVQISTSLRWRGSSSCPLADLERPSLHPQGL